MVYEWDEHRQTCYRLYIEDGKSLEDIRDHMKNVHKFTPSERAFRTQFRRWNFPLKQRSVPETERVVSRVKELWERNLPQREMLRILKEEGFDIKLRELHRLRVRNRWLLRSSSKRLPKVLGDDAQSVEETQKPTSELGQKSLSPHAQQDLPRDKAPLKMSKRQQKRKASRAVGHEGMIVRFPSETTLDDARQMLGLTAPMYRDLRSYFQQICEDEGIIKKTDAGVVRWDSAKEKLIRRMPELQLAVCSARDKIESRQIALDVICTDVTKRMRILETRMTLAEARNSLGINPEQFREIRLALYQALSEAYVSRKSNATPQQWENVKRAWKSKSAQLERILASMKPEQGRALDVLTRDILKRRRDGRHQDAPESSRQQPQQQQQQQPRPFQPQSPPPQSQQSGSRPSQMYQPQSPSQDLPSHLEVPQTTRRRSKSARVSPRVSSRNNRVDTGDGATSSNFDGVPEVSHTSQMAFIGTQLPESAEPHTSGASRPQYGQVHSSRALKSSSTTATTMSLEPQIESSMFFRLDSRKNLMDQSFVQSQFIPEPTPTPLYGQAPSVPTVCAIYMRLHPSSSFVPGSNLWIATLTSHSVQELQQIAADRFPGMICIRVEGVIKDGKGGELPLSIDHDQELGAYLAHLQGAAPTFNVQMVWKTS
ncbi:hypothetical protein E4U55_002915 [Claviceps digitariae]|nr:hypothetical protein E4U55_002915 [Claviceps digitariae]